MPKLVGSVSTFSALAWHAPQFVNFVFLNARRYVRQAVYMYSAYILCVPVTGAKRTKSGNKTGLRSLGLAAMQECP